MIISQSTFYERNMEDIDPNVIAQLRIKLSEQKRIDDMTQREAYLQKQLEASIKYHNPSEKSKIAF